MRRHESAHGDAGADARVAGGGGVVGRRAASSVVNAMMSASASTREARWMRRWRPAPTLATRACRALARFDSWNDDWNAADASVRARVRGASCDKVFACTWVDARTVVFGTKCNRVFEVDVPTTTTMKKSVAREVFINGGDDHARGGTYATCVNATREVVLASGGDGHDVCLLRFRSDGEDNASGLETSPSSCSSSSAVSLSLSSSLEPYCALRGHTDVVYGADFVTRDVVATASRDGCVKMWRAPPPPMTDADAAPQPTSRGALDTVYISTSGPATRVRGVKHVHDMSCPTLATITTHGHISSIDVDTASCISHWQMRGYIETSCVATNGSIIAAGSRTHIGLCDFRTSRLFDSVALPRRNADSARSLSFVGGNHLVVGGGRGTIAFFDIRARRWLMTSAPTSDGVTWHVPLELELVHAAPCVPFEESLVGAAMWADDDARSLLLPAIFCHAFDETFARLVVGGGPLHASLFGSFAGVWS